MSRASEATVEGIRPTGFQSRVMLAPPEVNLLLPGGRGGGKSFALLLLGVQHMEMYGDRARILYLRQRHAGTQDFVDSARELLSQIYGGRVRYNTNSHLWSGLPPGSSFEINQLDSPGDYAAKFQGRSFTLLLLDEVGDWYDEQLLALMSSSLRARGGQPTRMVLAANPGGAAHAQLAQRFILKNEPWRIFFDERSQREWVLCPSTLDDNPHLDQAAYERMIGSVAAVDPELARAWRWGDWSVIRGSFFAGCLDTEKVAIPSDLFEPGYFGQARYAPDGDPLLFGAYPWSTFLSIDWGSSAPCVCYLVAKSPGALVGDHYFARDSLVLIDEVALVDPSDLSKGLGLMTPDVAERFKLLADKWSVPAEGVIDDAVFARHGSESGSIAEELSRHGVDLDRARKGSRLLGWQRMREMLSACGQVDRAGFYVSRCCTYWWQTVPNLPRDPRQPDDVDTRSVDHAADASRYALVADDYRGGSYQHVHE